ncbi:hypothetical protein A2W24_05480 [Microgenomates group bacterium RBG_16_45_19]|nr:MAG: hypothetical protein A2W24_05480 [Microgenomates group bacterium RBG_16_45_19]
MWIKDLELKYFRNYGELKKKFDRQTTVLVGPNAVGKTNVLEAIYLLATGESFRAEKIEEIVNWQAEVAHITGLVGDKQLQVRLTRGEVQGKRTVKRAFKVNGVARRKMDFLGNLRAVIFRPEDLEIVTDSPTMRRRFLDGILTQVDTEYRRSLVSYEKALRRRNRLLSLIQEEEVSRTTLAFWDQLLIKEGDVLLNRRRELIEFINGQPKIESNRWLVYDYSAISEARLKQYAEEEVAAGYTLVGPHKDDFRVMADRDLAIYGSRGQQRMGVLWLKVEEMNFVEAKTGERPVLLLDDIFSELDEAHDRVVLGLLGKQQTIITTTEVAGKFKESADLAIERLNL